MSGPSRSAYGDTGAPWSGHQPQGAAPATDADNSTPLLSVEDLRVRYSGNVEALDGVDLALEREESLAVVGESGAGKTTLARALVGLLPGAHVQGRIRFDGVELPVDAEQSFRALRWTRIAYAPQGAAFNPVVPLEGQIAEPLRLHMGMSKQQAAGRVRELALEVGLEPALLGRHRHQLSGGQLRLALLAMALSCDPDLLILDEPTAGLDASTAHRFLEALHHARSERASALIIISHDLPTVSQVCARMLVLYAGDGVELGDTGRVVSDAAHPYTWALLNSHPVIDTSKDLRPIRGIAPNPAAKPSGCRFHPRCAQAEDICRFERPPLELHRGRRIACLLGGLQPLIRLEQIFKSYELGGALRRRLTEALRGVTLEVLHGEVVGLIGPSGSGKSTLAHIAAGLLEPSGGRVLVALGGLGRQRPGAEAFSGRDLWALPERQRRDARRRVALVFQNPAEVINPRLSVLDVVREPLDVAGGVDQRQRRTRSVAELARVGLDPRTDLLDARPHQLSGGEQQRVAIARALVGEPRLLLADEPTSMLDASEQARIIALLKDLQVERGMGMLFISHDVALVRKVADRILVLDEGVAVEQGPSGAVSSKPESATGRHLVQASAAFTRPRVEAQTRPKKGAL